MTRRQAGSILRGNITIQADDARFISLLAEALSRPPEDVPRILSVRRVILTSRPTRTMVGLTRYCSIACAEKGVRARQTITFYSRLLDALSPSAAMGVLAHELAHAWLNEHVKPDDSKGRELEADEVARRWGFGKELDALDEEADTV